MDREPFDFGEKQTAADDEIERPDGGEDDPALMGPVLEALKTVRDPEIPMDLVELGLIYELIVKKGGIVYVEMTLTTPACPVAASMPGEVETAIRGVPGVDDVTKNFRNADLVEWMGIYCNANPDVPLIRAADELMRELARRAQ